MPTEVASILALILALAGTITLFAVVLPRKKDGKLPGFLQFLHHFFHFKKLYLELILKVMYVFSTCLCIAFGFFLLFSRYEQYSYGFFGGQSYYESTAPVGIMLLVLGPIFLRVAYELLMLLILAVKNLMEINHNTAMLCRNPGEEASTTVEPCLRYCTQCGTQYDTNGGKCPNCGLE